MSPFPESPNQQTGSPGRADSIFDPANGFALSPEFFRAVIILVAAWCAVTGVGLWVNTPSMLGGDTGWIALIIGLASLAAPIWTIAVGVTHFHDQQFSRRESKALLFLAANSVAPLLLLLVIRFVFPKWMGAGSWMPGIETIFWIALGSLINQTVPVLACRARVLARITFPPDRPWSPHDVSPAKRYWAVFWMSILVGGFTSGASLVIAALVFAAGPLSGGGSGFYFDPEMMLTPVLLFPFGLFLGLLCGIVVAALLKNTNLNRSMTITFSVTIGTGALSTFPLIITGVLGAAAGGIISAAVCRSMMRLFPLGHCQNCGYSLAGITDPRCPECGHRDQKPPTPSPARAVEPVTADDATPADR